jgi:hypothetical protein
MGNQEKKSIINEFKKEFIDCMCDIDPKYMRIVDQNFWESLFNNSESENIGQRKLTRFN